MLPRLLARVVELSRRNAALVLLLGLLLAGACVWSAAHRLGVSTDTDALFADTLPWRQRQLAWDREFPQFKSLIVAVIDAREPEMAEATAAGLAAALEADPAHFLTVTRPDASPYLAQNGLLFLDEKPLSGLLDQTIDAQPFLGQLVADPSARGLFAALNLVAMGIDRGQAIGAFAPALGAFHKTLSGALDGHAQPLSWQNLLAGPLIEQAGKYRFVLIQPKLDFAALEPGGAATAALREAAGKLEYVRDGQAHVRITGQVPLADEEFSTVAEGALTGTLISVGLIALWLLLAVRSLRLIVPILATLMLGLLVTTGFASLAVGTLNLISVAFAILFVGIAVDFAIQFSVRYREERMLHPEPRFALIATAEHVGPQILVAGTAVAAGFLAFVPTDFAGVAELGLIAGVGMLVAFACTVTFLPAVITLLRPRAERSEIGFRILGMLERLVVRPGRLPILVAFVAVGVLGAVLVPRIAFDSDPLHTKNPTTEAMRTLTDLMDSPLTNPYSADVLAPDQARADAMAVRLRGLPLAAEVLTLSSFVPADQAAKLPLVEDAAGLLSATLQPRSAAAPVTPAAVREAARGTHSALDAVLGKLAPDDPLRDISADLGRLADPATPDSAVMAANDSLVRFLPPTLTRLRDALAAHPVSIADVPEAIARDWRLPDGRARVQVLARPGARSATGLADFSGEVRTIAPDAVGSAVTIVGTAATIVGAFRSAALFAILAIAVILSVVLRRALDVGLVLLPLLLSAMMTVVVVVLLPLPLNFANIIALPLLLGVGVSFNVYFVMNWRAGLATFLGTATARAVIFSALTTSTAFGSLALSAHPGTASMGDLLLISLACTLLVSLVFLPALLLSLPRPTGPKGRAARHIPLDADTPA